MKVWVVSTGSGEEYDLYNIFSTKEKAEEYIMMLKAFNMDDINEPEEWEIDTYSIPKKVWFYVNEISGHVSLYSTLYYSGENLIEGYCGEYGWFVSVDYFPSYEVMKQKAIDRMHSLKKQGSR